MNIVSVKCSCCGADIPLDGSAAELTASEEVSRIKELEKKIEKFYRKERAAKHFRRCIFLLLILAAAGGLVYYRMQSTGKDLKTVVTEPLKRMVTAFKDMASMDERLDPELVSVKECRNYENSTLYILTVRNPNEKLIITDPVVYAKGTDMTAPGEPLHITVAGTLMPGETIDYPFMNYKIVSSGDQNIVFTVPKMMKSAFYLPEAINDPNYIPVRAENCTYIGSNGYDASFSCEITNENDYDLDTLYIQYICHDEKGEIVGGVAESIKMFPSNTSLKRHIIRMPYIEGIENAEVEIQTSRHTEGRWKSEM